VDAECLACQLASGARELPGGRIFATRHWVVEHCVGPLGVGALVVKPLRHCLHLADLEADEASELGPLLVRASECVQELADADQVYVCLWSHAGWKPGHIHFVVQPAWERQRDEHPGPGPELQVALLHRGRLPPAPEVEAFCERARQLFRASV
jgi:diadenosine tetraphosphate (Ap4A) HIT family hydrolase